MAPSRGDFMHSWYRPKWLSAPQNGLSPLLHASDVVRIMDGGPDACSFGWDRHIAGDICTITSPLTYGDGKLHLAPSVNAKIQVNGAHRFSLTEATAELSTDLSILTVTLITANGFGGEDTGVFIAEAHPPEEGAAME